MEPLKRIRYLRADDKKSLLPDPAANEFGPIRKVIAVIAEKIRSEIPPADIGEVMEDVEQILDRSVSTVGYVIRPSATSQNYVDLSRIDFEALKAKFENGRKPIEAQKLRGKIAQGVIKRSMVRFVSLLGLFLGQCCDAVVDRAVSKQTEKGQFGFCLRQPVSRK